ncbi:MAG TPA: DUF4332 domain-containing protein [Hyphomicrobiaceae bacterium]|nr:DUF4332 domain-containing protein [Hyphomicrobiaceae bacterium]
MDLLFRIIYAAHARGTHHKLALDGLRYLKGPTAERWQRVLMKHAKDLMAGAKAPDDEFKDFKNHVLHVRDNFWGGAPEKARSWYDHLVDVLESRDWRSAAWCAGILSHYVTDPIHPFHTGQSEAENNVHRAVEWSINRSYDALRKQADAEFAGEMVVLGEGADWLERAICDGATRANAYYEKLIAHYDFTRGVVEPTAGIDQVGNRISAELIAYAAELFGKVLDRAIVEARVAPPDVTLTLETVLAAIEMPIKALQKKLADAGDRRQVERMYDELVATGTVETNLPDDDRMVRDLHRAEVLAKLPTASIEGRFTPPVREKIETMVARRRRAERETVAASLAQTVPSASTTVAMAAATSDAAVPAPASPATPPAPRAMDRRQSQIGGSSELGDADVEIRKSLRGDAGAPSAPPPVPGSDGRPAALPATGASLLARLGDVGSAVTGSAAVAPAVRVTASPKTAAFHQLLEPDGAAPVDASIREEREPRAGRPRIARDSAVVDAPSIGPKTADRLITAGIRTIGELIDAEPEALAARLATRHITPAILRDWQDQTRLVLAVPVLRGTHAQLLVGAGLRTAEALRDAEPASLCSAVLAYAANADGQRILRQGDPPDIERIKGWVDAARTALAA